MPRLPNTFIVGAPRSGTTSLHRYLGQHPDVFMSPLKEPRYFAYKDQNVDFRGPADPVTFNRSTVTCWHDYVQLFEDADDQAIVGETSPIYLYSRHAAANIRDTVPDARIIAILRSPVDRAYSDFLNMVRLAREPLLDFEAALEAEASRRQSNWSPFYYYVAKGRYFEQLMRYFDAFSTSQIKVVLFQDLVEDGEALMNDLSAFLGIEAYAFDAEERHNKSSFPRSKVVHKVVSMPSVKTAKGPFQGPIWKALDWIREGNLNDQTPCLRPETRRALRESFREDVEKLQDLIGVSLTAWLTE